MTRQFHEEGDVAGIALDTKGRGGAVDDFNNDGMLDIVVVNREHNINLFRNMGAKTAWGHRPLGNWAEIELRQRQDQHQGRRRQDQYPHRAR